MEHASIRFLAVALMGSALLAASTGQAHGRRGMAVPVIASSGDHIARVADLPELLADGRDEDGWALGWKYVRFGVFWADFYTGEKTLVMYKDRVYEDLPEDVRNELEEEFPFSECERGLWTRFGWLVFSGLFAVGVYEKANGR